LTTYPTITETITGVFALYDTTVFTTSLGTRLLGYGDSTLGQLGIVNATSWVGPVAIGINGRKLASVSSNPARNLLLTTGCSYDTTTTVTPFGCTVNNTIYGLGDNTTLPKDIVSISSGTSNSVAITKTGKMYAWGTNSAGQLGDGTTTYRSSPVYVSTSSLGKLFVDVKCGLQACLALTTDNLLYSWGASNGITATAGSLVPTRIGLGALGNAVISSFKVGLLHAVILTTEPKVYVFGDNSYNSLGDGTTVDKYYPIPLSGVNGYVTTIIGAGGYNGLSYSSGVIYHWGKLIQSSSAKNIIHSTPTSIGTVYSGTLIDFACT
jgi:alpha-tubulin suppressor-like RCC1 family protein